LVGAVGVVPGAAAAQQEQVTLSVTVLDQSGDPVGGVPLSATWDDGSGGPVNETTRSNGQALIDVPSGADVSIEVNDEEYVRNSPYTVEDASGQDINVSVSQSATATITVNNTAGESVENARVLLYRGGEFVTDQRTNAQGVVTTPDVEEGDYDLYIRKSGYYYNQTDVTVTGESELSRTIEEGSVTVTFNVTDDHFQPPQGIQNASIEIPAIGTVQTLSNGQATVSIPVNSQHDIDVTKSEYDTTEQTINIRESPTTVNVSINRTPELNIAAVNETVIDQSVELEVTDEYGEPVANATVTQDGESVGTTDADGELSVRPQSAGVVNYTVDNAGTTATIAIEVFDPDATDAPGMTTTADATETSSGSGPGFTPATVVAALALLSLLAYRRR
jgi:hypothetical protein